MFRLIGDQKSRHYQPEVAKALKDTGKDDNAGQKDNKKKPKKVGKASDNKQPKTKRRSRGKGKGKGRGRGGGGRKRKAADDDKDDDKEDPSDLLEEEEERQHHFTMAFKHFLSDVVSIRCKEP